MSSGAMLDVVALQVATELPVLAGMAQSELVTDLVGGDGGHAGLARAATLVDLLVSRPLHVVVVDDVGVEGPVVGLALEHERHLPRPHGGQGETCREDARRQVVARVVEGVVVLEVVEVRSVVRGGSEEARRDIGTLGGQPPGVPRLGRLDREAFRNRVLDVVGHGVLDRQILGQPDLARVAPCQSVRGREEGEGQRGTSEESRDRTSMGAGHRRSLRVGVLISSSFRGLMPGMGLPSQPVSRRDSTCSRRSSRYTRCSSGGWGRNRWSNCSVVRL